MCEAFLNDMGSLKKILPAATEMTGIRYIETAYVEGGGWRKLQYQILKPKQDNAIDPNHLDVDELEKIL